MFVLYLLTNKINGKKYVGYSKFSAKMRFKKHCVSARGKFTKQVLHSAIRKYGENNFLIETIEKCDRFEKAIEREKHYINLYKTNLFKYPGGGYNMTDGGEGFNGFKLSQEQKNKISLNKTGKKWPTESKLNFSRNRKGSGNPMFGKKHTEEAKKKISIANNGKPGGMGMLGMKHTKESIYKMTESRKISQSAIAATYRMREARLKKLNELPVGVTFSSKKWLITDTIENNQFIVENLPTWCKENSLMYGGLYFVKNTDKLYRKRWKLATIP